MALKPRYVFTITSHVGSGVSNYWCIYSSKFIGIFITGLVNAIDFARVCSPGLRGLTLVLKACHLALFLTVIRYILQRMQISLCLYCPSMLADRQIACRVLYNPFTFIGLQKPLVIGQFSLSLLFISHS